MFDVAVLGGGPAGLAVATALAQRGRTAVVVERDERVASKAGETFGPALFALLGRLGASADFEALGGVPFRGVRSAWGSPELDDRPSIQHPLGDGRHVDRARFEEMLQAVAERAGVQLRRGAGACTATRDGAGFRVLAHDGAEVLRARYVVDASGRGAGATAQLAPDRVWLSFDRQIALIQRTPSPLAAEPELLLESAEEGWWYAVPQPDGSVLTALLTDGDLAGSREERAGRLALAMAKTGHVRRLIGDAQLTPPAVVRADTGFLLPDRGPGWRAVGDAAMGGDPLAGDGVERALRGALDAAGAIERELNGAPFEPPEAPGARIEAYLSARANYYAREQRWPQALFWRRRQPIDHRQAEIWLSPVAELRPARPADPAALAPAEALVPRRALAAALALTGPAHRLLTALKQEAPLDDRRLLVALQLLVESGLLERT